ncbi:hypothetical protein BDZ89DRAFT_1047126 [Hymenopellis radicata]|nr:hypothetical protein BDZ89DRAFT_1047126 [Hymenopellis radicata]
MPLRSWLPQASSSNGSRTEEHTSIEMRLPTTSLAQYQPETNAVPDFNDYTSLHVPCDNAYGGSLGFYHYEQLYHLSGSRPSSTTPSLTFSHSQSPFPRAVLLHGADWQQRAQSASR